MDYQGPGRRSLGLILVVVLVLSVIGVGTSSATAHGAEVRVASGASFALTAAAPYKFDPSLIAYVSDNNTTVNDTIVFTNGDDEPHTFTIASREGWVIPTSYTPADLESFFNQYHPWFQVTANASSSLTVSFPAPAMGWYEFVCNETGHFSSGMYGFIAFGMALPDNLTVTAAYDGPGAAVFIIVGTIVTLTVIAIVLGFVVGRRRGALHEMPPERLGYPEPQAPAEPALPPRPPLPPTR